MARKGKSKFKLASVYTSIALTLIMTAMLVVVTFSWYTATTKDSIDSIYIKTSSYGSLYVVTENEQSDTAHFAFDHPLEPIEGDGENFFLPTEFDYKGKAIEIDGVKTYTPIATAFEEATQAEVDSKVITIDFSIVSTYNNAKLVISSASLIGVNNKTNANASAGSARIAIFEKDAKTEEYVKKCVWVPNSTYEIVYGVDRCGINREGKVESKYTFMNSTESKTEVTTNNQASGKRTVNGVDYVWGEIPEDYELCSVSVHPTALRVVLWISGEDRECATSLLAMADEDGEIRNGHVSLALTLSAIEG